jgi:hypothetical protein
MDKNIIVLGIVFIVLFIILRYTRNEKDGFFDFPDNSNALSNLDKEFVQESQKKFAGITNMINVVDSAVDVKSGGVNSTNRTLRASATPRAYTLQPTVIEKSIDAIPATIAMGKSCEAGGSTCAAFDDPTFAANCGVSFDINGTGTDGKPHIGGMYISPDDRIDQTAAAQIVSETGEPPYDPYQLYQPTLGSAKRGTFGITKEGCRVVKEKVDCLTNQTFDVKNCTQCYTSGSFARVDPETGRLPATIFLAGKGRVVVEGLVTGNHDLSTNAIQMDLPADAEGKNFRIKLSGDAPIYVSGYIRGTTPTGTFKLDIFNLVQSDLVTNAKARITGTMSVNEFTCVTMMPGTGQSTATFSCLVPFSFLNMYDGDAMTCDNGPIITKASSATFLESDPCFGKANKPGAYKLECLQSRWLQVGGTAEGTGYPGDQTKADALQRDANGNPLTINQIINNLVVIIKRARTGKNGTINLSIPEWNTASMFMLGIPINTPCDGPGGVPPLSQQCQQFLYANKGLGTRVGSTYTLPSSYSHTKEGFVQMYNYPGTSIDPDAGYNSNGGIPDVKTFFDRTNQVANDNSKTNSQRSTAVQQAFGVTLASRTPGKDDFDVRIPANQNTKTYTDMKSVCEAKGLRLCESSEICDMSSRQVIQPELPNSFSGDNWIAVGDKENEWLTLNNGNNRYCRTHSEVTKNESGSSWLPSWGSQREPRGWERLAKCCGGDKELLGRYIRLQFDHVECLNIAQIEVYSKETGGNIITPSTPVTKPDGWVYPNDYYPAKNLVDGTGNSFAHTSCHNVPWIEVDLGQSVPIQRIVVVNRKDCCKERIVGTTLIIMDGARKITYNAIKITTTHDRYTYFPPLTTVYGDYYKTTPPGPGYKHIGCWGDTGNRAMPIIEGSDPTLKDWYQARTDAIGKCYNVAKAQGYKYFGVQHGGHCQGSNDLIGTKRYGESNQCWPGGKGGPWANDVYTIEEDSKASDMPRQKVYGNNGSTTCERYCSGVGGGSWNNELPFEWNGGSCVDVDPRIGNCYSTFPHASGAPCTCVKTGGGWRKGGWLPS